MPDAVKGGLFVGAAVAAGILVGLFVPSLVVADRESSKERGPRAHKPVLPTMPSVAGQPLEDAEGELRRRGIAYETDAPEIVEVVVPGILEVCDSEPGAGSSIRGSARLHVAVAGTCGI
jgi:PASTA domain